VTVPRIPAPEVGPAPRLGFAVQGAEAVRFAAAPTVAFALRVESDAPVRSLSLTVQIRIEATRRWYDNETKERLVELFGTPDRWGQTLRSLLWTHATVLAAPFEGSTTLELPVPCTYDLEVASAKYFYGLEDGEVPLEFLFSGTVFYTDGGLLRTAQVSWQSEARFQLPVAVWKQAIEHHFPGTAWLRVHRDVFDRLCTYKAQRALPTWDATLEALLEERE
jgi:hypothetical protein